MTFYLPYFRKKKKKKINKPLGAEGSTHGERCGGGGGLVQFPLLNSKNFTLAILLLFS